jgi:hypothetical protein
MSLWFLHFGQMGYSMMGDGRATEGFVQPVVGVTPTGMIVGSE